MEDTLEFFRSGGADSSTACRRRWPDALKGQIVAETLEPGATVCGVAARHGLRASRLSEWRRLAKDGKLVLPAAGGSAGFAPLVLCDEGPGAPSSEARPSTDVPSIEIAVGDVMIRLDAGTSAARIAEIVRAVG
ncbi:IS66-like element accessory protein TnpA [Roseovarius tibetensis]|uniref:IS66-like element accessory protein TnpA n=1 Tax=Roseovarius tibetensis TaxID=2685897 RepID=UPI003D7F868F